jgi:hypothetical protein
MGASSIADSSSPSFTTSTLVVGVTVFAWGTVAMSPMKTKIGSQQPAEGNSHGKGDAELCIEELDLTEEEDEGGHEGGHA